MSTLKIDQASISIIGKNMLKTVYKSNCILNSIHLEKIRKAYTTLYGNNDLSKLKLLIVFQGDIEISQTIGNEYINSRIRYKAGEAFVTTNQRTKEFITAAISLTSSNHPIMVFSNENEALDWLEEL